MESSSRRGAMPLFAVSFATLFLELLLIRWIGTEARVFAFFRNLTLISCFLGLGLGFSLKRFRAGAFTSLALIAFLVAIAHPRARLFGVSLREVPQYLSMPEFNLWASAKMFTAFRMALGYVLISAVVLLLAGIFIPLGQILGDFFAASQNRIRDYSINLLGSLAGVWVFTLLCFLRTAPWLWFLLAAVCLLPFIRPWRWKRIAALALIAATVLLSMQRDTPQSKVFWSPYQKIELKQERILNVPYYSVEINSTFYMFILDLSDRQFFSHSKVYDLNERPFYPYDLPFRFKPAPSRVLIVGAGAGNDAAGALRNRAGHIDAVEIDPVIAELGLRYHPERPYQNSRVRLIVDDARSFLKKTKTKYDLILFALLDSHTLTSNFTNINLDSYVYTRESVEEARSLLAPGGIIALSFQVNQVWLGGKLYALLKEVFGAPPLIVHNVTNNFLQGTGGTLFLAGEQAAIKNQIEENPRLREYMTGRIISPEAYEKDSQADEYDVPDDDWPYLYLQKRQIPSLYYIMIFVIAAFMFAAIRLLMPGGKIGPGHFIFLGAGFMLLEVHSISKAALLFGSTWIVNVVIISAILVMILLANLVAMKYQIERLRFFYAGLFICLFLTYIIPVQELLFGNYFLRGIIAGTFYTLPMFFAGVIFACSIRKVAGVESAFAANMLGSTVGGMLESASFLLGLKAMVLLSIALYAASALALPRLPVMKKI